MHIPHTAAGDAQDCQLSNFPPSFGYDGLSVLLNRTPASLMADKNRKPWTLPPAALIPGAKSPVWLLSTVLTWLKEHEQAAAQPPAALAPPRRGRPTKVEQARRAAEAAAQAQAQNGSAA